MKYYKLGELKYSRGGYTAEEQYPELAGGASRQFTLQTKEGIYILHITINFVSQRLYYKIENENNEFLVRYNILIENSNLLEGLVYGYTAFVKDNTIYMGLTETSNKESWES